MALIIADRVKETATTTGTGTFTLGGAVTGFRTFNAGIGTGNTTYYCIFLDGTNEFEVGLGTYTAPDQLARDTVLASSNSGSKVNFSQGIKSVFCTQPSSKAAYLDASGNLSITTSNITEGTNLYYTDARFDTRLASKDTADLSEGTNLYYTDARARAAISVSGNAIAYNSSTGVITANFEESPTFTGNVVVSGNLTVTGTTTWLDSTNTQISDKNIVLNYASGDSSANADGAGITIQDAVDATTDASLTWNATDDNFEISHGLDFGDNSKARFGAGNDLQIYHDSSNNSSYIKETGVGSLYIEASNLLLQREGGTESFIQCITNGAVTLYYDNSAKLATTSSGIDVTGDVVADGLTIDAGGTWASSAGGLQLDYSSPEGFITTYYDSNSLTLGAGVTQKTGITINGHTSSDGSSIEFRTGNSETARFDSSGNFGIGTSSPDAQLEISNSTTTDGTGGASLRLTRQDVTVVANDPIGTIEFYSADADGAHVSSFVKGIAQETYGRKGALTFGVATTNATDASEVMRIDDTGNVGIGTTSPAVKLDVKGDVEFFDETTSNNHKLTLQKVYNRESAIEWARGSDVDAKIRVDSSEDLIFDYNYSNTSSDLIFRSNDSEVGRFLANGNVGIGTTSPNNNLHVKTSTNGGGLTIQRDSTTENDYSQLSFVPSTADNASVRGWIRGHRGTSSTNTYLTFGTDNAERLRIDSSGNVGIGTTSPARKLEVVSTNAGTDFEGIQIRNNSTTASSASILRFVNSTDSSSTLNSGFIKSLRNAGDDNDLIFGTVGSERVRIDSSGNVGIGTTSPSFELDVEGSIGMSDKLYHNGDHNTYIGFTGDTQTFRTGGTDRVTINNTGVGIGTDSPAQELHIASAANADVRLMGGNQSVNYMDVFSGASSAGLWSTGSNPMQFATNGTERMRIDNSGNVGIGTTSPASALHIRDASNAEITIQDAISSATARIGVYGAGGNLTYDTNASGQHIFTTNNRATEFMRINASGNVGIGTVSPSHKLHVSTGDTNVAALFENTSSNGTVAEFLTSGDGRKLTVQPDHIFSNGILYFGSGSYTNVYRAATHTFQEDASNTERMRITGGNVGIGTTSPSAKLEIVGIRENQIRLSSSDTTIQADEDIGGIEFYSNDSGNTGVTGFVTATSEDGIGTTKLRFGTGAAGAASERMTILSSGNVGIGTDSPSEKLEVVGDILVHNGGDSTLYLGKGAEGVDGVTKIKSVQTGSDTDELGLAFNVHPSATGSASSEEAMRIDHNKNVGIGTTSPSKKLHVQNGSSGFSSSYNARTAAIIEGSNSAGTVLSIMAPNTGYSGIFFGDQNLEASGIMFYDHVGNDMRFFTNNGEKVRIDSSGNLLVGATSPKNTFAEKTLSVISSASNSQGMIEIGGNNTADSFISGLSFTNEQSTDTSNFQRIAQIFAARDGNNNAGDLVFNVHDGSTLNRGMTIKSSGNVGIGTDSPSAKLEVVGSVGNFQTTGHQIKLTRNGNNEIYAVGASSVLALGTQDSEDMRIDSSGNLLVGKTSTNITITGVECRADGLLAATRNNAVVSIINRETSDGAAMQFRKDNTTVGSISVTGSATSYNTSSDARLKDDIGDFDGLGIVEQLNPRKFAWKADGQEDIGLYAQEVKELVPNAVSETEDGYYQMDYSKLVTPLIKAVQELTAKVESLEAQLANK